MVQNLLMTHTHPPVCFKLSVTYNACCTGKATQAGVKLHRLENHERLKVHMTFNTGTNFSKYFSYESLDIRPVGEGIRPWMPWL